MNPARFKPPQSGEAHNEVGRIDQMTDDEIDTSDIPPLDDTFFADAQLRVPKGKVPVIMSVDADVFKWFKSQGPEYQNLINTALRIYADEHKS